jgi:hypothetical protein
MSLRVPFYNLSTTQLDCAIANPTEEYHIANKKYVDDSLPENSQQLGISLAMEVIGGYPGAITSGGNITVDCDKIGNQIFIQIRSKADLITTGAVRLDSTTAIPVAYRPTVDTRCNIRITDNGNVDESLPGYAAVSSAGIITICKTLDEDFASPWTNATLGGWFSCQMIAI